MIFTQNNHYLHTHCSPHRWHLHATSHRSLWADLTRSYACLPVMMIILLRWGWWWLWIQFVMMIILSTGKWSAPIPACKQVPCPPIISLVIFIIIIIFIFTVFNIFILFMIITRPNEYYSCLWIISDESSLSGEGSSCESHWDPAWYISVFMVSCDWSEDWKWDQWCVNNDHDDNDYGSGLDDDDDDAKVHLQNRSVF